MIKVDDSSLYWVSTGLFCSHELQDEVFAFCRFSQINDKNPHLYIAAVTGKYLLFDSAFLCRKRNPAFSFKF